MATLFNKFKKERGAENSLPSFDNGGMSWDKMKTPQRREYIVNFLKNKGLNDVQVYAIVGNLQQENGTFNTKLTNSIGATGIAQWYKGRATALRKRNNPQSIDTQLEHLWDEIQGVGGHWTKNMGGREAFLNAKDLPTAVKIFRKDFERPGEHEAHDSKRIKYALEASNGKISLPKDFKLSDTSYQTVDNSDVQAQYNNIAKSLSTLYGNNISAEDVAKRAQSEQGLALLDVELRMMDKAKEVQKEMAEAEKIQQEALENKEKAEAENKARENEAILNAVQEESKRRELSVNAYANTFDSKAKLDDNVITPSQGGNNMFRFNTQFQFQKGGSVIQEYFDKPALMNFKQKYKL